MENYESKVLRKEQLTVDPTMQRPVIASHVKLLRSEWDENSVGMLIVSQRNDGSKIILDGQHRWAAAPDRTCFDCKVFVGVSKAYEAKLWNDYNKVRRPPTVVASFPMDLQRGDPDTIAVNDLVTSIGRRVPSHRTSNGSTVVCISAIRVAYRIWPDVVTRVFPLVGEVCKGEVFDDAIFRGILYLERTLLDASLLEPKLRARLISIGYTRLHRATRGRTRGTDKPYADAILSLINHGLHKKYRAKGINDDDC